MYYRGKCFNMILILTCGNHKNDDTRWMMRQGKHCPVKKRPPWPFAAAAILLLAAAWSVPKLLANRQPPEARPVSQPILQEEAVPPVPELPPEPEPQLPPEPEPDLAEKLLAEMDLREKVCQLFIVAPSAITGVTTITEAGERTSLALKAYPVGGLLYDRKNMISQEQVRTMLANVQSYSEIPLLLTLDEEGGRVSRLMTTVGTTKIGPMLDYKDLGAATAEENARTIAADIVSCGFNMNLAPVADVWSNPDNTVIGDRAYSDDFQQAAELVSAAVEGFHAGGAACVLKHFPGHGDTSADSHYGSVYVHKTLDELRQAELVPFQAGIAAGADAVMMGHMIIDKVDSQPALFSYDVVTGLLREEMGFHGVVMTDSLQMQAMTSIYGSGEIAVAAVRAGVDILLCPQDLDEAVDALVKAEEDGIIPMERLDESVLRILRMKMNLGLLDGRAEES